jgi:hypothetical protein
VGHVDLNVPQILSWNESDASTSQRLTLFGRLPRLTCGVTTTKFDFPFTRTVTRLSTPPPPTTTSPSGLNQCVFFKFCTNYFFQVFFYIQPSSPSKWDVTRDPHGLRVRVSTGTSGLLYVFASFSLPLTMFFLFFLSLGSKLLPAGLAC